MECVTYCTSYVSRDNLSKRFVASAEKDEGESIEPESEASEARVAHRDDAIYGEGAPGLAQSLRDERVAISVRVLTGVGSSSFADEPKR